MNASDLKIELVGVDELIPYAKNTRTHSDQQVAQIAASIREFGFTNPVLIDDKNGIIAGHGLPGVAFQCPRRQTFDRTATGLNSNPV